MASTTREQLSSELRRIREGIAHAFRDHPGSGAGAGAEAGTQPARPRRRVPTRLTIVDVMERDLATVLPESPVRSALALMIEHRISSVPVVDAGGRIVGALNEKDLMKVFYQLDASCVAAVMTRSPVTVSIDAPLVEVVDLLMASDFRRVLIHESERLVGVITRSHLMPALLQALEEREIARGAEPKAH